MFAYAEMSAVGRDRGKQLVGPAAKQCVDCIRLQHSTFRRKLVGIRNGQHRGDLLQFIVNQERVAKELSAFINDLSRITVRGGVDRVQL